MSRRSQTSVRYPISVYVSLLAVAVLLLISASASDAVVTNGKIAFTSNLDGNDEIYVMNADGSLPVRMTNEGLPDGEAAWSPDGSQIAFRSNRDGKDEIYVMNADGSGQKSLTNNPTINDKEPAWSPDGSKIAFSSERDQITNYEIWVMNADGSGLVKLTNNPSNETDPSWQPVIVPDAAPATPEERTAIVP